MRRLLLALPVAFAAALSLGNMVLPLDAHAGLTGCARQPQPGDGYDCRLGGPYGPGTLGQGNNCTTQCQAVKDCLNGGGSPPPTCTTELNGLNVCVRNARAARIDVNPNGTCYASVTPVTTHPTVGVVTSAEAVVFSKMSSTREVSSNIRKSISFAQTDATIDEEVCERYDSASPGVLLQSVVAGVLNVEPSQVQAQTNLYTDLGATWNDMRAIANQLETYFAIEISNNVVNSMNSISDLILCSEQASASL
ncbi:MAG: hypothetical protein J0M12_15035 [Deltaproteobacteria bacterium]|nr:hypothetical protein [Deltaproteobacteria bacterium]